MFRFVPSDNSAEDPAAGRLERIPEDALRLNFMQAGFFERSRADFNHFDSESIL